MVVQNNDKLPVIVMKHIPLHKDNFDTSSSHFSNLFAVRKRELCAERADSARDG